MKKIFAGIPHTKFTAAALVLIWTIAMTNSAPAAQLQEARVTQVVNDVKLLLEQAAPRPAAVSDLVRHGTAVRTGTQSRSELTFADLTITRLGANTIFSYKEGTREMTLIDGAILFQVPKGSGGATIRTVGVTAAITGTTGIAEFHPATTNHPQISKWLCLEGTFHLFLPNGQSVEVGPGRIVTTDGKSFSKVATFDIAKLVKTSLFFTGFNQPLASMNLIMLESENQAASLLVANTRNPLDPARIVNVTSQAIAAEGTPAPPASPTPPPPSPTPSKFGTPSVISSPNPYLITAGTVITTDPSITTNGVADFGKIYRGQTDDGPFSLWAFGSTSAFDTALRIDDVLFADPNQLPIAAFKFQSISFTGDPTIDTSNGVTKLALIGVDGITSGPPGSTLTFTGLDGLMLATVSGSINLTSDVSFQGLNGLAMYARGPRSNLTINSPISDIEVLVLAAEDSIHLTNSGTMSVGGLRAISGNNMMLQIGGSLSLDGRVRLDTIILPGAGVDSGANLILNVAGDYTNDSATESSRFTITNRDQIRTGGNIATNIGGNLTAMNDFALLVQNTNSHIDNGGNISLRAGGINVAGALDATLDNTGGLIGSDTSLTIASSGALSVHGDATFQILNSDNGTGGRPGQISGNAAINVTTGEDFSANSLTAMISNYGGASIGGHALINLTANTLSVGGNLDSRIDNTNGTIGGNAAININVSGNATITNDASFQILGSDGANTAAINLNGGNYNVGGTFLSSIDGNGTMTFNNAGAHADVLKAGVFGPNGVLNIGGGTLSADSTLKLYAPGSNGQLNFISNVTLGGNSAKILAANSITIFNNVVVTIGGSKPADVYAGFNGEVPNANYTGFGGNGSTTGTFAGAGANDPQPLSNAPPFDPVSRATVKTNMSSKTKIPPSSLSVITTGQKPTADRNVAKGKKIDSVIHVSSSDELLALLENATPGPGGKITVRDSKRGSHQRNAGRSNAAAYLNADRREMDKRTASIPVRTRLPQ